jgi:histone deacetylase complex regulatory component SIN3
MYAIDLVQIGELEFRCQSAEAQGRGRAAPLELLQSSMSPGGARGGTRTVIRVPQLDSSEDRSTLGRAGREKDGGSSSSAHRSSKARGSAASQEAAAAVPTVLTEEASFERDAEQFLGDVRAVLEPQEHSLFVDVMVSYMSNLLDTVEVMEQVASLLSMHPVLLYRFNRFLPEGYRIETLPRSLQAYAPCFKSATPPHQDLSRLAESFVARLVERFASQPEKLQALH